MLTTMAVIDGSGTRSSAGVSSIDCGLCQPTPVQVITTRARRSKSYIGEESKHVTDCCEWRPRAVTAMDKEHSKGWSTEARESNNGNRSTPKSINAPTPSPSRRRCQLARHPCHHLPNPVSPVSGRGRRQIAQFSIIMIMTITVNETTNMNVLGALPKRYQPSAVGQHSTARHSTSHHSTAQHNPKRYQPSAVGQHSTARHSTAQHITSQHSTTQRDVSLQHWDAEASFWHAQP
jgi:hypothetical protein